MPILYRQNLPSDRLRFDGVLSENYTLAGNITDHPIERREDVTDHRQQLPFRVSVEGTITGSPMVYNDNRPSTRDSVLRGTVRDPIPVFGDARLRSAVEYFERNQGELFEYVSVRLGVIRDLMLESVEYEVDNENRLVFQMDFKSVVFGRSEIVDLPPLRRRTLEPTVNEGEQPGEEVSEIDAQSLLSRGEDLVNSVLGRAVDQ